MCRLRINAVNENSLFPVRKIRAEPGEGSVRDAKGMLESSKKNSMVNGVEGCREIKECEERNFAGVSCKEEVVENVEQGCFSTMRLAVG